MCDVQLRKLEAAGDSAALVTALRRAGRDWDAWKVLEAFEGCGSSRLGKGSRVRVFKGRPKWKNSGVRVELGTEGYVAWCGGGAYGPAVGFKLDGTGPDGDICFTSEANVELLPTAGWRMWDQRQAEMAALQTKGLPGRGKRVRAKRRDGSLVEGKVCWSGRTSTGGYRVGVKVTATANPEWFSVADVEAVA